MGLWEYKKGEGITSVTTNCYQKSQLPLRLKESKKKKKKIDKTRGKMLPRGRKKNHAPENLQEGENSKYEGFQRGVKRAPFGGEGIHNNSAEW